MSGRTLLGLVLGGCDGAGELRADGVQGLDEIQSAAWVEMEPVPAWLWWNGLLLEGEDRSIRGLHLWSARDRSCVTFQEELDAVGALSVAVVEAGDEAEARCEAMAALAGWYDARRALLPEQRTKLEIGLAGAAALEVGLLAEGLTGTLKSREEEGCAPEPSWDASACAPVAPTCAEVRTWELDGPWLRLDRVGQRATGVFGADLLDEDGADAGSIEGDFSAPRCALDAPEVLVLYGS